MSEKTGVQSFKLSREEKNQIMHICDLTKYYFMERYLMSLKELPEALRETMVNDMDKFYTDSNAEFLNARYVEAIKKHTGVQIDETDKSEIVLKRARFEKFAEVLYYDLLAYAEDGQNVDVSSDTKKLFSRIGCDHYSNSVLDACLQTAGIPNESSILDSCRVTIGRDKNGELQTKADRIIFPVEKEDEVADDVSDLIHTAIATKGSVKFVNIPLEECYEKYFSKEYEGMEA